MDRPSALTRQDEEHLKLLVIFHSVVAAMQALFASFPIIHLAFGVALLLSPESFKGDKTNQPPPEFIGWIFTGFAGVFMLVGYTLAFCTFLAGRFLKQRRRRTFCFVVAGIMAVTCAPFGTALGVFTIVVLLRESVARSFDA